METYKWCECKEDVNVRGYKCKWYEPKVVGI